MSEFWSNAAANAAAEIGFWASTVPKSSNAAACLQMQQYLAAAENAYTYNSLSALGPPIPEPGIIWKRTGGKTWRVTINR